MSGKKFPDKNHYFKKKILVSFAEKRGTLKSEKLISDVTGSDRGGKDARQKTEPKD